MRNARRLILQRGIIDRRSSTTIGKPKNGHGPSQKNRIWSFLTRPISAKKRRNTRKKQLRKPLQSHPIQRRSMRISSKAFFGLLMRTANSPPDWPSSTLTGSISNPPQLWMWTPINASPVSITTISLPIPDGRSAIALIVLFHLNVWTRSRYSECRRSGYSALYLAIS